MAALAQVSAFTCAVPAGTTQAAPAVFPLALPLLDVVWIKWRVPPGPEGFVGFWIGSHGQQIIPHASGAANWLVADDESEEYDLDPAAHDFQDWELRAYNTGTRPHTLYLRVGLAYPADAGAVAPALIPAGLLAGP